MSGVLKDQVGIRFESASGEEILQYSPGIRLTTTTSDLFKMARIALTDTKEALPTDDLVSLGFCVFANEGTEEVTIWNGATGEAAAKIPAGGIARFRPSILGIYASAETSDPGSQLLFIAIAE